MFKNLTEAKEFCNSKGVKIVDFKVADLTGRRGIHKTAYRYMDKEQTGKGAAQDKPGPTSGRV